jgi:hypothetical protein
MKNQLKQTIKKILPNSLKLYILRNFFTFSKVPANKKSVISDLFPFNIGDGWNTYFELLNFPRLIDPINFSEKSYQIKFVFFDQNGKLIKEIDKIHSGLGRETIDIKELIGNDSNITKGTFACFHNFYNSWLESESSFLAERGYIGFQNTKLSVVRSYVHGNFDALSRDISGKISTLGTTSWKERIYNLQYELKGGSNYDLAFVNSSNAKQNLKIEFHSLGSDSTLNEQVELSIPSKGIRYFSKSLKGNSRGRIIIKSKLKLARPVVFRSNENSFDVFHG